MTSTIAEVTLHPLSESIGYLPGQYMLLEAPGGGRVPRSYSPANAPRPDGTITLLVTRVPGGELSPWIYDDLAPGDQVLLSGPYDRDPHLLCWHRGRGARPRALRTAAGDQPGLSLHPDADPRGRPPPLGRIPALLPELSGDLGGHSAFIAGAPGFVRDCARAARAAGASAARIHTEEFFVEKG